MVPERSGSLFILGTLILFALHKTKMLAFLEKAATPLIVISWAPAKVTEAFIIDFFEETTEQQVYSFWQRRTTQFHQILVSL